MKSKLWKLIHQWRDATTTETAWIARDQIAIELGKIEAAMKQEPVAWANAGSLHNIRNAYAYIYPTLAVGASVPLYLAAGAQPTLPEAKRIATAPSCLNVNDKAMWVTGWNECRAVVLRAQKEKP
jgi:hypothetical protein